jgi:hypothetical protein
MQMILGKYLVSLLVLLMPIFLFSVRHCRPSTVPCNRSNFVAQNSYVLTCAQFTLSFLMPMYLWYQNLYLNNKKVNNLLRLQYVCCYSIK